MKDGKGLGSGRVVSASEWEKLPTPDIYFTPEYHATSALANSDFSQSVLLEWHDVGGKVYLPLMLRSIEDTSYFDATSAYGYGGPWTEGNPSLSSFYTFFDTWAKSNSIVSTFIRFHPLIMNAEDFTDVLPVRSVGPTARWDLTSPDLVQGMAKNHRKNWRRAIRTGVTARVTHDPDDVNGFRSLYEISMARLFANDSYWLPDQYWDSLRDKLGKSSLLVEAIYQNRVVAAAWCLLSDNYLHFHLSGTLDEGRRIGGAYVCRVAAAEWAKTAGLKVAHHGGGVGGSQSSLLDWKMKFDESASLADFYVAEVVHDEQAFQTLSQGLSHTGFFPPWRAPAKTYTILG